jgi:hypothetical protein
MTGAIAMVEEPSLMNAEEHRALLVCLIKNARM